MSTIQVNAIQSSTGTQEVTQTTIFSGTAKAWVYHDVAASIDDSFNISSVTDVGTGDFDPQLANSMSDALYTVNVNSENTGAVTRAGTVVGRATGSFDVITYMTHSSAASENGIAGAHSAVMGSLA